MVKKDTKKLDNYIKNIDFLQKNQARIGVFSGVGNNIDSKNGTPLTTLGYVHEYGSVKMNIPSRSWLHMPLNFKKNDIDKKQNSLLNSKKIYQVNGASFLLNALGAFGLGIIQDAFQSNGFGAWQKLRQKTIQRRHEKGRASYKILVDTGEFAKSIVYNIFKKF